MKVFLSHSGERSRALAERTAWFLRNLIPNLEPWISTGIEKGSRWESEIAEHLADANVGIVCLTRDNLNERWLLYEAGALSKQLDGRVCTLLLDVDAPQVLPPLNVFQHTRTERDHMLKLVLDLNGLVADAGEKNRDKDDLVDGFHRYWPDLEKTIRELRDLKATASPPTRTTEDLLAELLDLARSDAQQRWMQEKALRILQVMYEANAGSPAPDLNTLRQTLGTSSRIGMGSSVVGSGDVIPRGPEMRAFADGGAMGFVGDPIRPTRAEPLVDKAAELPKQE